MEDITDISDTIHFRIQGEKVIQEQEDNSSAEIWTRTEHTVMPTPEYLESTESTSHETFDNSDAGSWSSDTPLLFSKVVHSEDKDSNAQCPSETDKVVDYNPNKANDMKEDNQVVVDIDGLVIPVPENNDVHAFGSGVSIAYSLKRDAERVRTNPVHVFGSGWEFGSVCSVNLHGSGDVFRSRTNTIDHHGLNNATSPGEDRLLSRIFKGKIGNIQFDKSKGKEADQFFSPEKNDISTGERYPTKTKNLKNLLILSTSLTFLHIAVFGLRNLQSSINSENGLGVFSLATLCGAFMFGSLASPFVVQKYGPKICLSLSCFGNLIYIIANNLPSFYIIIPASVVHGLSSALLWNALCTYITEIGLDEAAVKGKVSSNVLSRYFGIFFLALQMSMVLGNLISSLILSQSDDRIKIELNRIALYGNIESPTSVSYSLLSNINKTTDSKGFQMDANESFSQPKCGAGHCDVPVGKNANPQEFDLDKTFLLGTYSSCAIISILVIQCFLDKLPDYTPYSQSFRDVVKQARSVVAMVIDRKFCFIVMLCLYTVISNGFVVADVLKAFITCPLGVRMVGFSMISFGLCGSVSSYMFGKLAKCTGNMAAFLTGLNALTALSIWNISSAFVNLRFINAAILVNPNLIRSELNLLLMIETGNIMSFRFESLAAMTSQPAANKVLTWLSCNGGVAAVLNVSSLALMTSWEPSTEDQYLLFAFVGAWGFADGIWQSQVNSLISSMFADRYETAFSCCRVLQGLAGIVVFTMSNMMCMMSKIIFTTGMCLVSVILYIVMEVVGKKTQGPYLEEDIIVK